MATKVICANILILFVLAYTPIAYATGSGPRLDLPRTDFDLGFKKLGEPLGAEFILRNFGDEPLEVRVVSKSCNCSVTDLQPRVMPGAKTIGRIQVQAARPGKNELQIHLVTNSPGKEALSLRMRYEGVEHIYYEYGHENQDTVRIGETFRSHFFVRSIHNDEEFRIDSVTAASSSPMFHFDVNTEIEASSHRVDYTVDTNVQGRLHDSVVVRTNSDSVSELLVPLQFRVEGPYVIEPDIVSVAELRDHGAVKVSIMRMDRSPFKVRTFESEYLRIVDADWESNSSVSILLGVADAELEGPSRKSSNLIDAIDLFELVDENGQSTKYPVRVIGVI